MSHCVRTILSKSLPTLLLGGGGYNVANAARLWTRLTADAVNRELGNDIPDNKVGYLSSMRSKIIVKKW